MSSPASGPPAGPPRLPRLPLLALALAAAAPGVHGQEGFKFKSGVELVNVNVTVTDRSGFFVGGLTQDDFVVYDDNAPAGDHAFQRRARAGQPRHHARHQRQHGRGEDGVGASRRSTASCSSCWRRTTTCS